MKLKTLEVNVKGKPSSTKTVKPAKKKVYKNATPPEQREGASKFELVMLSVPEESYRTGGLSLLKLFMSRGEHHRSLGHIPMTMTRPTLAFMVRKSGDKWLKPELRVRASLNAKTNKFEWNHV